MEFNIDLVPLKDVEIISIMFHLMESCKYRTEYGNIGGLLYGLSLGQEDGTAMGYSVRVFYGEEKMRQRWSQWYGVI